MKKLVLLLGAIFLMACVSFADDESPSQEDQQNLLINSTDESTGNAMDNESSSTETNSEVQSSDSDSGTVSQ